MENSITINLPSNIDIYIVATLALTLFVVLVLYLFMKMTNIKLPYNEGLVKIIDAICRNKKNINKKKKPPSK